MTRGPEARDACQGPAIRPSDGDRELAVPAGGFPFQGRVGHTLLHQPPITPCCSHTHIVVTVKSDDPREALSRTPGI